MRVIIGILFLSFALTSCGSKESSKADASSDNSPKTEQKEVQAKKKGAKGDRVRFPKLRLLPPAGTRTQGAISTIGETKINAKTQEPIVVSGERFAITGWAIDKTSMKPAGAVFIDIDGQKFGASYGRKRKFLEKRFDDPALHATGFRSNIKTELNIKNL